RGRRSQEEHIISAKTIGVVPSSARTNSADPVGGQPNLRSGCQAGSVADHLPPNTTSLMPLGGNVFARCQALPSVEYHIWPGQDVPTQTEAVTHRTLQGICAAQGSHAAPSRDW